MKSDLDPIELKIIRVLKNFDKMPGRWGTARCTSEVKRAIAAVGRGMGYEVACTNRRDSNSEWLYDICWLSMDNKESDFITDMPLAVECEWGASRHHILEDFQKLMISRADRRVLLCSQTTPEDWHDCLVYMQQQVRLYRGTQNGDRYLFGNWGSDVWEFEQYVHPGKLRVASERVWLFQALKDYDLDRELGRRKCDWWLAKHYRDNMQPGNLVLLWQSGSGGGIRGIGELASRPYCEGDAWWIKVKYLKPFDPPITRSILRQDNVLRNMDILKMPRGTNFRVRDSEWAALKPLLAQRR